LSRKIQVLKKLTFCLLATSSIKLNLNLNTGDTCGLRHCLLCVVGTTSVKAKVLKDGHVFVVHIVDPHLEVTEEIPSSEISANYSNFPSSTDTFNEEHSSITHAIVVDLALIIIIIIVILIFSQRSNQ